MFGRVKFYCLFKSDLNLLFIKKPFIIKTLVFMYTF